MIWVPTVLWMVICIRGLWKWRNNANEMDKNLAALQSNGKEDKTSILFAKADRLMDNLRAVAFLNAIILGAISIPVTGKWSWVTPLYLRIFGDYFQWTMIGSFAIFMFNGEIYGYVLDKVKGRR